jgi:hypothetical protein
MGKQNHISMIQSLGSPSNLTGGVYVFLNIKSSFKRQKEALAVEK